MSITIRMSADRGHANHGWLDAYHTFSFADFRDPQFDRFGPLRVLNHDTIEPGEGFPTHGHRDMEIVTYVMRGALAHKDDMGNGAEIHPGEIQVMSAGTGVLHSEFNPSSNEQAELLQMWVMPAQAGTKPWWDQRVFPEAERRGRLRLVVSPDAEAGALPIGQDVRLFVGLLDEGESAHLELSPGRQAWIHIGRGEVTINRHRLTKGDGAAIVGETSLTLEGRDADFVIWDLPE
jgi:quercetin 2,3-dioxygenase